MPNLAEVRIFISRTKMHTYLYCCENQNNSVNLKQCKLILPIERHSNILQQDETRNSERAEGGQCEKPPNQLIHKTPTFCSMHQKSHQTGNADELGVPREDLGPDKSSHKILQEQQRWPSCNRTCGLSCVCFIDFDRLRLNQECRYKASIMT